MRTFTTQRFLATLRNWAFGSTTMCMTSYTGYSAAFSFDYVEYICGDANRDLAVDVGDAVYLINYVFKNGDPPDPLEAGETNCDGAVNVGDAVYLINYVFKNGPTPCDECP